MALLRHISILIVIYMISQPFCRAQIVEECPAGSVYSTSNGRCVSCSLGYYNDKPGGIVVSNDYSDCKFCPIGHKCPTPDQTPIKCPRGTVNSVDRLSCTPCSPGYYTDPDGAGWLKDGYIYSDCKLCLYGHYCPTPDVGPIICPPGTYSREGSTECTSCPEGYYNPRPGGTSKDSCLECPHGRYCPSKTQLPLECPPGTMSNSGRTSCISCPDGTYNLYPIGVYQASSGYAWYDECLSCPKQHYCPSSVKCPNPCPPKTENNYERKYKMDDCKPCNCTTTTNFSCKEQTYTNDYNNNFTISVIENNQQCLAKGDKNKMCDCDFYRRVNETFLFCSSIKDSMLNLGHELCKVLYSTPKINERWRDNVVNCLRKMAESLNIDSGCVNLAKNINRIHELCYLTADLYSTDKHSYTNLKCWEKSIINKAITKNFADIIQSNKILSTLTGQEYYSYVSEKDAKENCDILTYVHASLHAWYNETKYIKIIQFNPQFASYFDYILKSAQECNSFIVVTDSFRRHWHNITDDYYTPAKKSNHRVGYALDFNLSKNDCSEYCNSTCLNASIESAPFEHVDCFLGKIKTNSIGLEWGGLWQDKKPDTVHIYYNLTKTDSNAFDYYYSTLQKNCN